MSSIFGPYRVEGDVNLSDVRDRMRGQIDKWMGARLRFLRKERGISQHQIAEALGYTHRSSISKFETGFAPISFRDFLLYCAYCRVVPSLVCDPTSDLWVVASLEADFPLQTFTPRDELRNGTVD